MRRRGGAVEVGVATVDVEELSGDVAGPGGGEPDDGIGEFRWFGQASFERDEVGDLASGPLGIRLAGEPALVLVGVALRGNDGVDPNAMGSEGEGPFAGEGIEGSLGRGVARSPTLPRGGDLGADVHDGAPARREMDPGEVGERVGGEEVPLEGGHEGIGRSLQSDAVVHPGVVDQDVEVSEMANRLLDRPSADLGVGEVARDDPHRGTSGGHPFGGLGVAVDDQHLCSLGGESIHGGGADSPGSARDEGDPVGQFKVHGLGGSPEAVPLHRGNRLAEVEAGVAEGGLVRASIWRLGIAWLVAWAMGCLCAAEPSPSLSRPLRVAAASDLTFVMPELNRLFATVHPGQTAETILGASGTLVAQIRKGAPFDVFLSADRRYPEALVADGLAVSNSFTHYANGRVVLWSTRAGLDPRVGLSILRDSAVRRLAIANPLHAPYGRAAQEILSRADLWGGWSNRVVLGETVAQTAQWVESGTVDLGLVSRSWVMAPQTGQLGRWWEVPTRLHEPLEQVAVVTRRGESHPGAELYRNFLRSQAAIGLLERFGFDLPRGGPETTVPR